MSSKFKQVLEKKSENIPSRLDPLKLRIKSFLSVTVFFEILETRAQLITRPKLNPWRSRIDHFTLECFIDLKLRFFSNFWNGLTAFLGQNVFSLHLGNWRQTLAIEVFYKYLRIYNIRAISLIFKFSKCYWSIVWLKNKEKKRRKIEKSPKKNFGECVDTIFC